MLHNAYRKWKQIRLSETQTVITQKDELYTTIPKTHLVQAFTIYKTLSLSVTHTPLIVPLVSKSP